MFPIMKKAVNIFICHFLYQVRYENIENLNEYERCLICPNHKTIFDPFFIFTKTDNLYIMAKSNIFKNKLFTKILTRYNVFPIVREKKDVKGSMKALELFKQNEKIKLLMFPEGGILKDNEKHRKIKSGAVHIASIVDVPIVPVHIIGNKKPFSKMLVKFGEPIVLDKSVGKNKEKMKEESQKMINLIYDM